MAIMHYNFVRIHGSLQCTLAMAAGVTPRLWELADMVTVLEDEGPRDGQGVFLVDFVVIPARISTVLARLKPNGCVSIIIPNVFGNSSRHRAA